jgi:hypothetical protein
MDGGKRSFGQVAGMINVLGMRMEDLKYLIENKIFAPEKVQYGIWYDCKIPLFQGFNRSQRD